jgi:hypothetical protein
MEDASVWPLCNDPQDDLVLVSVYYDKLLSKPKLQLSLRLSSSYLPLSLYLWIRLSVNLLPMLHYFLQEQKHHFFLFFFYQNLREIVSSGIAIAQAIAPPIIIPISILNHVDLTNEDLKQTLV